MYSTLEWTTLFLPFIYCIYTVLYPELSSRTDLLIEFFTYVQHLPKLSSYTTTLLAA